MSRKIEAASNGAVPEVLAAAPGAGSQRPSSRRRSPSRGRIEQRTIGDLDEDGHDAEHDQPDQGPEQDAGERREVAPGRIPGGPEPGDEQRRGWAESLALRSHTGRIGHRPATVSSTRRANSVVVACEVGKRPLCRGSALAVSPRSLPAVALPRTMPASLSSGRSSRTWSMTSMTWSWAWNQARLEHGGVGCPYPPRLRSGPSASAAAGLRAVHGPWARQSMRSHLERGRASQGQWLSLWAVVRLRLLRLLLRLVGRCWRVVAGGGAGVGPGAAR